jgi:hypothetical protein
MRQVEDSFYDVHAASSDRLEAESVTLTNGTLTVRFDNAAFRKHAGEAGELQISGEYTTTAYDRVYFEHSVLNADVEGAARRRPAVGTPRRPRRTRSTADAVSPPGRRDL